MMTRKSQKFLTITSAMQSFTAPIDGGPGYSESAQAFTTLENLDDNQTGQNTNRSRSAGTEFSLYGLVCGHHGKFQASGEATCTTRTAVVDGMAVTIEYAHYRSGVVPCVDDKLSTIAPFRHAYSDKSWRVCVRVSFNLNLLHKLARDTDNNFNKINSFSQK